MIQPVTAPEPRSGPTAVVAKIRAHGPKYSAVSAINVLLGQGLLLLFHAVLGIESWTSNILAVCISAVPAYYLTRAWVWGKRGRSHLTKEVLPFWAFAVAGLFLSTFAVWATSSLSSNPLLANVANIAAFGILWVVKFFVLDAYIFGRHQHRPETDEALVPGA